MKTAGSDRLPGRISKTEESKLVVEIAKELKKTAAELYFVRARNA